MNFRIQDMRAISCPYEEMIAFETGVYSLKEFIYLTG
jgi:hypothetical protein